MITRRQIKLLIGLVIVLLIVAACDGSSSNPTAVPPTTAPPTDVPAVVDTPVQQAPDETSAVSYSVTGDAEVAGDYSNAAFEPPLLIGDSMELLFHNGSQEFVVILSGIPTDITPGTYDFASEPDTGDISARFDLDLIETLSFLSDVSGTLTITATGDNLSGSFAFSASTDPGAGGEVRTVTVSGALNNVPMPSS